MKRNKKTEHLIWLMLAAAILTIAGIVIYESVNRKPDNTKISYSGVSDYAGGWSSEPDDYKGDNIVLKKRLPKKITDNTVLCVVTNHQTLTASVGGSVIYEYGGAKDGRQAAVYGRIWNMIEIPKSAAGEEIILHYTGKYSKLHVDFNDMMIGDKNGIIMALIKGNLDIFLFCAVVGMMGVLLCIAGLWMILHRKRYNQKSFIYVGIFLILCSVWIFTDSNVLQFFSQNAVWRYYLSFGVFMLFPVPLLLYVKDLYTHGHRILNGLCITDIGLFFVNFILHAAGIPLAETILDIHIFLMIATLTVVALALREKTVYGNRKVDTVIWGLSAMGITSIIGIIIFTYNVNTAYSVLFRIGILVFVLILCFEISRDFIEILNENQETLFYKKLAYMDALTNMENRLSFEHEMWKLSKQAKIENTALFMLDVNDLKVINDTKGHTAGDETISGTSQCIRQVFEEKGTCYRIGGDEFAVIIKECTRSDAEKYAEEFDRILKEYNSRHKRKLVIAYGYALNDSERTEGTTVEELFNASDRKMYQDKERKQRDKK